LTFSYLAHARKGRNALKRASLRRFGLAEACQLRAARFWIASRLSTSTYREVICNRFRLLPECCDDLRAEMYGRMRLVVAVLDVAEPSVFVCPHFVDYLPDCCDDGVRRFSHVVLRIHDDLPTTRRQARQARL